MYHLGPARGTSFHTAIIPDRTKIATAFSSPLPHFFLPVPGAFWCISPAPRERYPVREAPLPPTPAQTGPRARKDEKITFLLFFQGKIYYTIKDCIRTCIPGAGTWCFQPLAFFSERRRPALEQQLTKNTACLPPSAWWSASSSAAASFFKAEKILNATGGDLRTGILAWIIGGLIAISNACAFAVMATRYQKVGWHGGLCRGRRGPGLRLLSGLVPGRGLLSLSDQHPGLGVRPLYLCPAGLRHRQRRVHDHHPCSIWWPPTSSTPWPPVWPASSRSP